MTHFYLSSVKANRRDHTNDLGTRVPKGRALDDNCRRKRRQVVVVLLLDYKTIVSICVLILYIYQYERRKEGYVLSAKAGCLIWRPHLFAVKRRRVPEDISPSFGVVHLIDALEFVLRARWAKRRGEHLRCSTARGPACCLLGASHC